MTHMNDVETELRNKLTKLSKRRKTITEEIARLRTENMALDREAADILSATRLLLGREQL